MDREGENYKWNEMEMREGKDDVASNVMVRTVPLALANPSLSSLVAQLVPPIPTLLDKTLLMQDPKGSLSGLLL
jgi:hypothetical protein